MMLELLSILVIVLCLWKFKLTLGLLTVKKCLHKKLRSAKQSIYLINISVASKPAVYKLGLLGNTERNLRKISRLTNQTRQYQVC